jgi:hypothetical protein
MSLRSYDIVAWVLDGEIVCADCMNSKPDDRHFASPVFAGEEFFDHYPTCAWCGELIDEVSLIEE